MRYEYEHSTEKWGEHTLCTTCVIGNRETGQITPAAAKSPEVSEYTTPLLNPACKRQAGALCVTQLLRIFITVSSREHRISQMYTIKQYTMFLLSDSLMNSSSGIPWDYVPSQSWHLASMDHYKTEKWSPFSNKWHCSRYLDTVYFPGSNSIRDLPNVKLFFNKTSQN